MGSNEDQPKLNEKPDCKVEKKRRKRKTVLNSKVCPVNLKEIIKMWRN